MACYRINFYLHICECKGDMLPAVPSTGEKSQLCTPRSWASSCVRRQRSEQGATHHSFMWPSEQTVTRYWLSGENAAPAMASLCPSTTLQYYINKIVCTTVVNCFNLSATTNSNTDNLMSIFWSLMCFNFTSSPGLYTGCPRRNGQNFGRVFLILNYTDITQNTYVQSWTVTEIMAREKCGHLAFPRTVLLQLSRNDLDSATQQSSLWLHALRPTR